MRRVGVLDADQTDDGKPHDKSARENERGHISIGKLAAVHDPSLQSSFGQITQPSTRRLPMFRLKNADAQGLRLPESGRFSGTVCRSANVGRPQFGPCFVERIAGSQENIGFRPEATSDGRRMR